MHRPTAFFAAALLATLLATPAHSQAAEAWKQVSADMYVDTASTTRSFDAVNVNVKYTYDKEDASRIQATLKSKERPAYSVQRKSFFCNTKKVSTAAFTYYSASGAVIAQGSLHAKPKTDVPPDSRIEPVFDFVCNGGR